MSNFNFFNDNDNNNNNENNDTFISKNKIKNFTNSLLFDDEEEKNKEIYPKSSKNLKIQGSLINNFSNTKPKKLKFEMEIPVNKNSEINHFKKNKSVNLFNIKKLSDNKMDYTIKIIQNKNNTPIIITKENLKHIQHDEFLEPFEL